MPYRNEHSCRLEDPKKFQKNSFRRLVRGDAAIIIARPYGSKKTRAQAIRYPTSIWTEGAARESCQKHGGKFEPALSGWGAVDDDEIKGKILSILTSNGQVHIDNLIRATGAPAGKISAILFQMELDGQIKRLPGGYFALAEAEPSEQSAHFQPLKKSATPKRKKTPTRAPKVIRTDNPTDCYSCEPKQTKKGYHFFCKKKKGVQCDIPVGASTILFDPDNKEHACKLTQTASGSFRMYCKPKEESAEPTMTKLIAKVRECLRKEKNAQGRTVCREWTKNYKMVSPKEVECFLPGRRPPAAVGPMVTEQKTFLSEDEVKLYETLSTKTKTSLAEISQETNIPTDRAKYGLMMLELKGLIIQPQDEIFRTRSIPLTDEQTGLVHNYSHPSGGDEFTAVYQLLEIEDVRPSHQALNNFRWTPGYPKEIQDRDYSNPNLPYQGKVFEKAASLDPSRVISTAKTSVEGPPIVVGEGNIVLSGNSRALSIIYASSKHPNTYRNYLDYLANNALTFGLSAQAIRKMRKPMLVRRVAIPPSTYKLFASLANESPAMALDILGTLQAVAKYVPDDIVMTMDIGDEETLRAYIASSRGQRFAKAIMSALPATKVGAYVDRGMLTEEGKALIEGVLFYKLLPDIQLIEKTPKSIRNTISFAIPEFFRLRIGSQSGSMQTGWDLTEALPRAIRFYSRNLTEYPLSFFLRQESLFEEEEQKDVFEEDTLWGQLVVLIDKFGNSPRKFRDILRAYANRAEEVLMPEDSVEVLKELIGGIKPLSGQFKGFTRQTYGLGLDIFDIIGGENG